MGLRRLSRKIALSLLFQYETGEGLTPEETLNLFLQNFDPGCDDEHVLGCDQKSFEEAMPYGQGLFFGVIGHQEELDGLIQAASDNWRLERMSRVDRNLLRLALFEMKYVEDVPPKVSINEAIDLGKEFGAEDSGAFINGVLDRLLQKESGVRSPESGG